MSCCWNCRTASPAPSSPSAGFHTFHTGHLYSIALFQLFISLFIYLSLSHCPSSAGYHTSYHKDLCLSIYQIYLSYSLSLFPLSLSLSLSLSHSQQPKFFLTDYILLFRQFCSDKERQGSCQGFIDGDVIESFLDLDR